MSNSTFDFSTFPILASERLHLREMTLSDVTNLLKHFGNPSVVQFIDMQPIKTIEQANEWLKWMGGFFAKKDGLRWAITLKDTGEFIGSAGLHSWNREANYAEIGFDITPPYWAKGYATETLEALVNFGWQQMKLNRIEADIVTGNHASVHVLEKSGFTKEGVLRQRLRKGGKYYDIYRYSLLNSDVKQIASE